MVQVFEILVGVICGDVHGLGDRRVNKRLYCFHHGDVFGGRHFQRVHEVVGQGAVAVGTMQRVVQAESVVIHVVFAVAAIGFTLAALVGPREGRLNTVRGVVGKGQADRAGRCDGQQVAVAQAVLLDGGFDIVGQTAGKALAAQVLGGVEFGESAFFFGQLYRCAVGGVTHTLSDLGSHLATIVAVVVQAQHAQGVAQASETYANTAFASAFFALLGQRPPSHVQHVV